MSVRDGIVEVWHRAYRALRPLRRTTIIGPLVEAAQLRQILKHIRGDWRQVRALGPDEFAPYLRALTPLSPFALPPRDLSFDFIIVRQDHLNGIADRVLATLDAAFACTAANPRFALFEPIASGARLGAGCAGVADRVRALMRDRPAAPVPAAFPADRAIFMTTFNRPLALRRSLPAVAALGQRVLVVDDGSHGEAAAANQAICDANAATRLALPENRGLVGAMNIGLAYWFADPDIKWLSYFQDDVDVAPDVMTRLRALEDLEQRPLLTGYDADEHPAVSESTVNGLRVKWKSSSPAVHLHAHVTYWKGIWPLPSEYLGAPRRRWEASLEDYWIVNHAPNSVGKRGLMIPCLPNLVRTFLHDAADSTWGNPNQADPPLAAVPDDPTAAR